MQGTSKRKGSGSLAVDSVKRGRWEDELAPPTSETAPIASGSSVISGVHTVSISGGTPTMIGRDSNTTIHNHSYCAHVPSVDVMDILNSPSLPKFRDIQQDTLAKATDGTCLWLIKGETYPVWFKRGKILWGIGIPGAGKTILASIVISDLLLREEASGGSICVAFVYLRYSEPLTLRDILESFVKQILEHHVDLAPMISGLYSKHTRDRTKPSQNELMALLTELSSCGKVLFFVLDALDELRETDRLGLVWFLATLNAKVFITSRILSTLQQRFPEAHFFDIVADPSDIKRLVHDILHHSANLMALLDDSGLEDQITETICLKAGGMFLHARLQLEALRHCINILDVEETLEEFPAEIELVYAKTWERILAQAPKHANLAKLVFLWILSAECEITVDLLRHLVSTCPETHVYQPKRLVPEGLLTSACCGLVSVDPKTRIVRLIHYTTKDAILPRIQELYPFPHSIPTAVCLAKLTSSGFQNVEDDAFDLKRALKQDPLINYAYYYWAYHARQCRQHEHVVTMVLDFTLKCTRFPCYLVWGTDFLSPLHVAARYGLDYLIPELAHFQSSNTHTPILKATPLTLACEYNHMASAKALLSLPDTDVNLHDSVGWTALIYAIGERSPEIMQLLLDAPGIDINAADNTGETPLNHACSTGQSALVALLLQTPGIDVNASDIAGWSPLIWSASEGHLEIVKMLLDAPGIDVNAEDNRGRTALLWASEKGHLDIVNLLLAHPGIRVPGKLLAQNISLPAP